MADPDLVPPEVEALRLCAAEGLSYAEAGARLGVSRQRVEQVLKRARKKIALGIRDGDATDFERRYGRPAG